MISKDIFKSGMRRLEIAFCKDIPKETIVLYYEKLKRFNDDSFRKTVEDIIDNDNFFPSIARFNQKVLVEPNEYQPPIEDVLA